MEIAISSGKGGTGKTFIATNLAVTLAGMGEKVTYLDCDVEEPNGHLFLKPRIDRQEDVVIFSPVWVDEDKCILCGKCAEVCHYNAIAVIKDKILFFKERLETAKTLGIKREKIIIDPGIGFGKRHNDNLLLIKNLRALEEFERPIMIGISRKSFIGKILNLPVLERIEGTIASAVLSIIHGAHILRVHDVAPIKRAVLVAEAILEENRNPDSSINNMEKNYNYVC